MSIFNVGDKVKIKGMPGTYTLARRHVMYDPVDGVWEIDGKMCVYREETLSPIPVKKRYEVVRVVEAESEEEAVAAVRAQTPIGELVDFIAREVK